MDARLDKNVDRRDLLRSGGAALGALLIPGWSSVFGQAALRRVAPEASTLLRKSIELARFRGLPLIVLRAPTDAVLREKLGEMWGAWLSLAGSLHLPDENARSSRLSDLALCDLVCATDADIVRELPSVSKLNGWTDGIALVVEPTDALVSVVPGPVIEVPWFADQPVRDGGKLRLMSELAARLHAAVAADLAMVRRRAHENYDALNAAQKESLSKIGAQSEAGAWAIQAACAPACLRLLVDTSQELGPMAANSLAHDVEARLDGTIGGSRWEIPWWDRHTEVSAMEIVRCVSGPCGTGMTPAPSVRFLRYFTETGTDVPPSRK
jgi:hypothetical protein